MSAADVTIRRARPGDSLTVRSLVIDLGYDPDDRRFDETFYQVVRHPEAAVFVAAAGVRVLGYVAVSHRPQIRLAGRTATIDDLVVDAGSRGRGIGTRLLEAAIAYARGLGCRRIEVSTRRTRESHRRGFYLKHGFVEADSAILRLT